MSLTLTTALPAKLELISIFNAKLAAEKATAFFNEPNFKTPPEENVYVLDVEKGHREWHRLGSGPRRAGQVKEAYSIRVDVVVQRHGSDSVATEERAWQLAGLCEEALAENVRLGNLVESALPTDFDMQSEGGTDGWRCTYSFAVAIEALV